MKRLQDVGEEALIRMLTRKWPLSAHQLVQGVGDDCAVLKNFHSSEWLLLKTDAVVENVHFTKQTSPKQIGWKALSRCISDIAAMGGLPKAAMITLGARSTESLNRLQQIYAGIEKCAQRYKILLVGGETTRASELFLSVSLIGHVKKKYLILRKGARTGDCLFVTGTLGGSIRGKHLTFEPRLREAQWLVKHFPLTAMMDVSDGLELDLFRLCKTSKKNVQLNKETIPKTKGCSLQQALSDGEDFELLFTLAPQHSKQLIRQWPFPIKLTKIGEITSSKSAGSLNPFHGYNHFKKSGRNS